MSPPLAHAFAGITRYFFGNNVKSLVEIFPVSALEEITELSPDLIAFHEMCVQAKKSALCYVDGEHKRLGIQHAMAVFVFQCALAGYELELKTLNFLGKFDPEAEENKPVITAARAAQDNAHRAYVSYEKPDPDEPECLPGEDMQPGAH